MKKSIKILLGSTLFFSVIFTSCKPTTPTAESEGSVIVHSLDDPRQLNPSNAVDGQATVIFYALMQNLLNIDFQTGKMIPVLANAVPEVVKTDDGTYTLTMEIRKEATWDNGEPITGKDIAFNVKIMKVNALNNTARANYFEFIQDVIIDETNPKKFTFVCKPYFGIVQSMGDLHILPAYAYDADGVLENYTIKDLIASKGKQGDDETLNAFAEVFNGNKFQREVVVGSGPYKFESWKVKERIVISRKENWWGHQLKGENQWFEAFPTEIVYERINDLSTATSALKSENLDAMNGIDPKTFVNDLKKLDEEIFPYDLTTPPNYAYDYIGINMARPKFQDVKTRKALAHVMNVEELIETACSGLGERTNTFIHPTIKQRLNSNLKPYDFNIEKAKTLLAEAGWGDSNKDGILDKIINGKLEEMKITVKFNAGNTRRETTALIFQAGAKEVGIEVEIETLPWESFRQKMATRDFDLYMGGWISSPLESDPKQIWHSESQQRGSNYVGFANAEADKIIGEIRNSMDVEVRNELYKDLQQIIHDEVPYIFLLVQKERVAVHNKFIEVKTSGIKPGYWTNGFSVMEKVAN